MAFWHQEQPQLAESWRVRIDSDAALLIALEAENAVLRAALARSETAGVRRDLITRKLAIAFGGEVELDFKPAGLECRLRAPASGAA
jgi:hypothetical protein